MAVKSVYYGEFAVESQRVANLRSMKGSLFLVTFRQKVLPTYSFA
jgi:hypothetical protein